MSYIRELLVIALPKPCMPWIACSMRSLSYCPLRAIFAHSIWAIISIKQQELIMQCWQGNSVWLMYTCTIVGWIIQAHWNTWVPGKLAATHGKLAVKPIYDRLRNIWMFYLWNSLDLKWTGLVVSIVLEQLEAWKNCGQNYFNTRYSWNVEWFHNHKSDRESNNHQWRSHENMSCLIIP